jgi:hypothetical protein
MKVRWLDALLLLCLILLGVRFSLKLLPPREEEHHPIPPVEAPSSQVPRYTRFT